MDRNHRPDLTYLIKASETIGKVLKPGAVIVYESTVYPGVTEAICGSVRLKLPKPPKSLRTPDET
ncbi:MAG: hypothetical protein AB1589_42985 [Cyanobacteriota bacterium]